jgi:hypothetical protein
MQVIELDQYPDYDFRTDLGDVEFLIRLRYLERFDTWLLDLCDKDESPIAEGLPVVLNKPLLSQIVDPRRPAGELMFVSLGSNASSPNFDDFGKTFLLYYLTNEEIAAARADETL